MDVSIGTSLIGLTEDHALAFANKFYRPLGWTRVTWTIFAARRLCRGGGAGDRAPD